MATLDYDDRDIMILSLISEHSSMREISATVGRSPSTVKYRIGRLVEMGLVAPPGKRQARGYKLTSLGSKLIEANFGG